MAAATPVAPPAPDPVAAAFRRLYPDEFFGRVLAGTGARPDGRPPSAARPLTLAIDTASDGDTVTALARAGRTAALAGVRLEVTPAPPTGVSDGTGGVAIVSVDASPLCVEKASRLPARLAGLADAVRSALVPCVDTAALLVPATPTSPPALLVARVDILLLDADGGEAGACIAAGAAALAATAVPGLAIGEGGGVVRAGDGAPNAAAAAATAAPPGADPGRVCGLLKALPVGVSIGLWTDGSSGSASPPVVVVVDPSADEEKVFLSGRSGGGLATAVVDASSTPPSPLLHAAVSPGSTGLIPHSALGAVTAAARERGAGVREVLVGALGAWRAKARG